MANYLLVYHGGGTPEAPTDQEAVMQSWIQWFEGLGSAVVDEGNRVSRAWTVSSDGTDEGGGANPCTGYSVLTAPNMDSALIMARGCPILRSGGTIELCETVNAGM